MLEEKIAASAAPVALRDEDGTLRGDFVDRMAQAIVAGDAAVLRTLLGDLHESDVGDLIQALDAELRPRLVSLMGADFDFSALTEVDSAVRVGILEELPAETVAAGVRNLDSDDAVAILVDLPQEKQTEIVEQLPSPERVALARSLLYPENSAGRRMQTEFIAVPPAWTVGRAIDYLRETPDLPDRFWEFYVVDTGGRLQGTVALDRLLRTKRPVPIEELIDEELHAVRVSDDQEDVARLFERYDLVSAPVVDASDRLVGVITFDDIVDVIEEEAEEDIRALGGVGREEELSDPVFSIARGRFNWLLVNLATAFLASSVLGLFEGELQKWWRSPCLRRLLRAKAGTLRRRP
jgi:magnesium transporter